jgi:hypothetical protein
MFLLGLEQGTFKMQICTLTIIANLLDRVSENIEM